MTQPTIPLTADVRKSYEELYATNETAIEGTEDEVLLPKLNATQLAIGAVLSADNKCRLDSDTATFGDLLKKIDSTNKGLEKLKKDISEVTDGIKRFGDVVVGIDKVLTLIPAI